MNNRPGLQQQPHVQDGVHIFLWFQKILFVKEARLWNYFAVRRPLNVEGGHMRVGGSEVRYSHLSPSPNSAHCSCSKCSKPIIEVIHRSACVCWKCTDSWSMTQTCFATNIPKPWHNSSGSKDDCWSCTLRLRLSTNSSWDAAPCALQQNALRSFGVTPISWYWSLPRVKRSLAVNPFRGEVYVNDLKSAFDSVKFIE